MSTEDLFNLIAERQDGAVLVYSTVKDEFGYFASGIACNEHGAPFAAGLLTMLDARGVIDLVDYYEVLYPDTFTFEDDDDEDS